MAATFAAIITLGQDSSGLSELKVGVLALKSIQNGTIVPPVPITKPFVIVGLAFFAVIILVFAVHHLPDLVRNVGIGKALLPG